MVIHLYRREACRDVVIHLYRREACRDVVRNNKTWLITLMCVHVRLKSVVLLISLEGVIHGVLVHGITSFPSIIAGSPR